MYKQNLQGSTETENWGQSQKQTESIKLRKPDKYVNINLQKSTETDDWGYQKKIDNAESFGRDQQSLSTGTGSGMVSTGEKKVDKEHFAGESFGKGKSYAVDNKRHKVMDDNTIINRRQLDSKDDQVIVGNVGENVMKNDKMEEYQLIERINAKTEFQRLKFQNEVKSLKSQIVHLTEKLNEVTKDATEMEEKNDSIYMKLGGERRKYMKDLKEFTDSSRKNMAYSVESQVQTDYQPSEPKMVSDNFAEKGNMVYAGYAVSFGVAMMVGKYVYQAFKRAMRPVYPVNIDPTNDL